MMSNRQGVISVISFPIGQDKMAVSKAIYQLLEEGWKFDSLDEKGISLRRCWEVYLSGSKFYQSSDMAQPKKE